jgi:large subunit ribosomal protein L28
MKGSMCFLGFRVSLPISLAVGSPKCSATNPCATSWKIAEKTRIIIEIMPPKRATILSEIKIYDIINAMGKGMKCDNCGKGIMIGHNVSHAKNRTRRIFKPNLHSSRVVVNGLTKRMRLCTKCLRTAKKKIEPVVPSKVVSEVPQVAVI